MNLELGGGLKPEVGFVNLDPVHGEGRWKLHAESVPWPAATGSVDRLRASHVLEHIDVDDRIDVMNEAHRVLKPGGLFEIIVPLFPSWRAIADPTHRSWWVRESFSYFTGEWHYDADYGISLWGWAPLADIAEPQWWVREGWEGHAWLTPR